MSLAPEAAPATNTPGMLVWPGFSVLVGLGDVAVLVDRQGSLREQGLGVAVWLDADRQHDEVVLGLDDVAAVARCPRSGGSGRRSPSR